MSLTKAILWYRGLTSLQRSVVFAVFFVTPVVLTGVLTYYIKASLEHTSLEVKLIYILTFFTAFVICRRYVELRVETLDRASNAQTNALGQAYTSLDSIIARRLQRLHSAFNDYHEKGEAKPLFEASLASLRHIQDLIDSLYQVVQSQFGQPGSLLNDIDFEVTFMTKSYIDQKITIYAHQNRDNRAPRSLLQREKSPDIYDCTITAQVYRETRPEMRIVEDTFKDPYSEVYPGQRDRIKSSVIYPVLSDRNELLGTIVTHCNRSGFFRNADRTFWRKLLELYAKRVAYEKVSVDLFAEFQLGPWANHINASDTKPNR